MSSHWIHETPVSVCPTCGDDITPWVPDRVDLDWRDLDERDAGYLAVGLMAHRYAMHRPVVMRGDIVRYWSPWRGLILGSEVYRIEGIREHDGNEAARDCGADVPPMPGTTYYLVNPAKPKNSGDWCWPFVGDPRRPIVFELLESAPPVEVDLLDLLGWEVA